MQDQAGQDRQGRGGVRAQNARRARRADPSTADEQSPDSTSENKAAQDADMEAGAAPGGREAAGRGAGRRAPPEPVIVRPLAKRATIQRRHSGLFVAFVLIVVIPTLLATVYLYVFARDQYASSTGFTVRSEETSSASELVGGLSAFVGSSTTSNANVLYAFIHSQEIVERTQQQVDLLSHYSEYWRTDPVFSIWPDATIEDLLWFWHRIVTVSYDQNSGLMDVQVTAHTAEMAQRVARVIVSESEEMINALNEQARRDTMANAQRDLDDALERLRAAREELAGFRARTQIVDPQADIAGRMGVINGLQSTLAQALVDYDLLLQTSSETDPRVRQAERRIEVIRQRIGEERRNFATQDVTTFDTDYPRLIAQFEALTVNQEFAEQTYTAALTSLDSARSNAQRQSLYLATYVRPTLAQRAEFPRRLQLVLLTAGFLVLIWAALAMVYYSLRDRG